jgi:S-adenosylmethionine:tRNA ribosyltransferase-isomerase
MNTRPEILIKDFEYALPPDKIAAYPLPERDKSKLLIYKEGIITITSFEKLSENLPSTFSLLLNNTKVIEARILFQKDSGGIIEIFLLEPAGNLLDTTDALKIRGKTEWKCLIGGASKWKHGEVLKKEILLKENNLTLKANFLNKDEDAFIIEFSWEPAFYSFEEVIHDTGTIPLPPYIKRKPVDEDTVRYQTVFARNKGSVAAPTAALHFTQKIFDDLTQKGINWHYITLHVGAGTFKPVKTGSTADHKMHAEQFQVSLQTLKKLSLTTDIVAVGTTSLRTLESLYWIGIKVLKDLFTQEEYLSLGQWEAYDLQNENTSYSESISALVSFLEKRKADTLFCQTSLLIVPGYKFQSAKALITNFHQPQSTLLLLIAAFIGADWRKVYDYALENSFRFLSYGDSSLLWRKEVEEL